MQEVLSLELYFFLKSVKKDFLRYFQNSCGPYLYMTAISAVPSVFSVWWHFMLLIWKRDLLFGIRAKMLSGGRMRPYACAVFEDHGSVSEQPELCAEIYGYALHICENHAGKLTFEGKHVSGGVILFGVVALLLCFTGSAFCARKERLSGVHSDIVCLCTVVLAIM